MFEKRWQSAARSAGGEVDSATKNANRWTNIGFLFQLPMMVFFVAPIVLFHNNQPSPLALTILSWTGVAVFGGCLWTLYFRRARLTHLITSGVYRFTRHPMYIGLLLMNISHWAASGVWNSPLFLVLEALFVINMVLAGYCQERETLARFGQQAVDYYRRTPRIPFTPW